MTNKEITVYYASPDNLNETQDWGILYKKPQSLKSILTSNYFQDRNNNLDNRGFLNCTAFQRINKNLFVIENPLHSVFTFKPTTIQFKKQNSLSAIYKREPQLENQILFEYNYPWIFFAEESLEMQFTAPYFLNAPHLQYGAVTPAQYNIGKWFRPVQLEFNCWENVKEFEIQKDEPIAFVNFLTDKKINFKMFDMTPELAKIMNVCATASVWEANIPLVNRYKRFHESKMLSKTLNKVKNNLV